MKHDALNQHYIRMLANINRIPRNILSLSNHHNTAEFVLHNLCHPHCFNITKAAYLVDNSDFDCLKGVAGFDVQENFDTDDIWSKSSEFTNYMQQAAFNTKVRSFERTSGKLQLAPSPELMHSIGQELGMSNAQYCLFPMKYDNTGVFIYQSSHTTDEHDMLNGLSLLSFCPLY